MTFKEKFIAFHHDNPQVYSELVKLARQAKERGRRKLGVRMLWEVMRWNLTIMTKRPPRDFKLNDHYHSRYARLIMKKEADLAGMFEIRTLKTKGR